MGAPPKFDSDQETSPVENGSIQSKKSSSGNVESHSEKVHKKKPQMIKDAIMPPKTVGSSKPNVVETYRV